MYETSLNHVLCCCPSGVQPLAITKSVPTNYSFYMSFCTHTGISASKTLSHEISDAKGKSSVLLISITEPVLWGHWGWIHFNFQLQWMRVSISQKSCKQNVLFKYPTPKLLNKNAASAFHTLPFIQGHFWLSLSLWLSDPCLYIITINFTLQYST